MIHWSEERRVRSIPLIRGFRTSVFERPFGLAGSRNHSRARSPGISNEPFLLTPKNAVD